MNHFELLGLIQNFQIIYTFLVDRYLLAGPAEMILKGRQVTLVMVTFGNVCRATVENIDQSGLDLSLKTPIFHLHNDCRSSICGPLVNPTRDSCY